MATEEKVERLIGILHGHLGTYGLDDTVDWLEQRPTQLRKIIQSITHLVCAELGLKASELIEGQSRAGKRREALGLIAFIANESEPKINIQSLTVFFGKSKSLMYKYRTETYELNPIKFKADQDKKQRRDKLMNYIIEQMI